jgi:hypothetical protein
VHAIAAQAADIRFLFAYDRWATRQVLTVLDGLDSTRWSRPNDVGERGLGRILVHHLGASQRWRIGLQAQHRRRTGAGTRIAADDRRAAATLAGE